MKKIILVCFLSLFIGCLGSEEEDLQVKLEYKHKEDVRQYRGGRRPVLVAKHEIDVRDFQEKYIYDKAVLDENLTGTVMVPVEVDLEVQYKNYSFEEPELYYESGVSEPFKVLFNSAPTRTVTIPVTVNPDYPVEEDTTDNETEIVETIEETFILSWSDNFTRNVKPTQSQENTYKAFWNNASNYQWDNITIGNSDNTTTCDNSTIVNSIVDNIDNTSYNFKGLYCNGLYWTFGKCGWGNEISAFDRSRSDCACLKTTDVGFTIRPLIGNTNWGGVGRSCGSDSQTLKVILGR